MLDAGGRRGEGPSEPFLTLCELERFDGGWTLVAALGHDARPAAWSGAYPRPGASAYGELSARILDPWRNGPGAIAHFSAPAGALWEAPTTQHQVLAYVGGIIDDWITAQLDDQCNYFDIETICLESTYGPYTVLDSNGDILTEDAYACTTLHDVESDPYDEFGLNLLDGHDSRADRHCHENTSSSGGFGYYGGGRIFTSFQSSSFPETWEEAVRDYWSAQDGSYVNQPGALFIR